MNIVNLCCSAYAPYSGTEYEENINVSEEFYVKIQPEIEDIEVYIYELDGKYSEIEASIDVESYNEEEILGQNWDLREDSDSFYYKLNCICEDLGLDLNEEIKNVKKYLESLDTMTQFEVRVKKSDKEKVLKFVEELNKNN